MNTKYILPLKEQSHIIIITENKGTCNAKRQTSEKKRCVMTTTAWPFLSLQSMSVNKT